MALLHAHLVFVTHYRRPVFTDAMLTTCEDTIQRLKGRTARDVRPEHTPTCVRARMCAHLWSPSYVAVSCGGPPLSIIKQHIDGQARPL